MELLYGIATILAKLDRKVVITVRNSYQFAKAARELSLRVEKQGESPMIHATPEAGIRERSNE